jgi:hypothetical protein
VRGVAFRGYTPSDKPAYLRSNQRLAVTMIKGDPRMPFERPHILELWPRSFAVKRETTRITREWTPEHRMRVSGAMSSLLGTGMKRVIQREHPDWDSRKITLEVGRLSWGWEIAPPLYGPLEEEARARGEASTRRAEFLASWRLDPADEPIVRASRKRTLEDAQRTLDRLFGE